jgi:LemA protein
MFIVTTMIVVGAVIVVVVVTLFWFVLTYNRLVQLRTQVRNSWASVEVQLKRRHDLIPNLVQTVQGYAAHERETLEAVDDARTNAALAPGPAGQAAGNDSLTRSLNSLFAVAESYPDLKADQEFIALQRQLDDTEDHIAYARLYYNDAVLSLNNKVSTVPSALVASMFHFQRADFFKIAEGEDGPVTVRY